MAPFKPRLRLPRSACTRLPSSRTLASARKVKKAPSITAVSSRRRAGGASVGLAMREPMKVNFSRGVEKSKRAPLKSVIDRVSGVSRAIRPSPTIML